MTNHPPKILESPDEITSDWLTAALRTAGELPTGYVRAFTTRAIPAFNSAVVHIELTYSGGMDGPRRIVCKVASNAAGKGEVEFYNDVRFRSDLPMLVRSFYAAHDEKTGISNLILDDLSQTHEPPVQNTRVTDLDQVPTDSVMDGIVDSLGTFHGRWWQNDALRNREFALIRPWYRDREYFHRQCERRRREWVSFTSTPDGDLPSAVRQIYETTLAAMPSLWDRFLAPRVLSLRGLTLTHGDCYLGQFLCPRGQASARTYIADFGDVSGNFGPYDLVYAFCTFWTRDQRREGDRELRLLRRYHHALIESGVEAYPLEQLLADYRLIILFMIFDPVWNQTDGTGREYWWPKMQCLTNAYEDWDCAQLM
jgi:hypothetical protein